MEGKGVFQPIGQGPSRKVLGLYILGAKLRPSFKTLYTSRSLGYTEQKKRKSGGGATADRFLQSRTGMEKTAGSSFRGAIRARVTVCRGKKSIISQTPRLPELVPGRRLERQVFQLAKAARGKAQRQPTQLAWAESLFFNYSL